MAPVYAGSEQVHADPRYGLPGLSELGEFLNGGVIFGNGYVTLHAFGGSWKGHHSSGVGIGVAACAGESERDVSLVAIGQRLHRGRVRGYVIRNLLL